MCVPLFTPTIDARLYLDKRDGKSFFKRVINNAEIISNPQDIFFEEKVSLFFFFSFRQYFLTPIYRSFPPDELNSRSDNPDLQRGTSYLQFARSA